MGTMIDFSAVGQDFQGYQVEPEGPARGAVLVIHEIWGLTAHIKSIADRFAAEGYLAVAPNLMRLAGLDTVLLTELGDLSGDPAAQTEIQPKIRAATAPLNSPESAARTKAGVAEVFSYLDSTPEGAGRTAAVGFCFGGSYAFALAAEEPLLQAAVAFYGQVDYPAAELAVIGCPVLAFYGAEDTGLMVSLPELTERMQQAGVDFRPTVFPGAGHAFFNDVNPIVYRDEPARISWGQTLAFLDEQLAW